MLGKEVVFIGMGKRAEIWDKARWDAKNAEVEADIEDIASEMEASGFSIEGRKRWNSNMYQYYCRNRLTD